jgi:hypothetical protein
MHKYGSDVNSGSRSRWIWVGSIVAIGVIVACVTAMPRLLEAVLPTSGNVRTQSQDLIAVTLRDGVTKHELRLEIPKAYLVRRRDWRGGYQESVHLQTRWPEMVPAPAIPPGGVNLKGEGDPRQLELFDRGLSIYLEQDVTDPAETYKAIHARLTNVGRRPTSTKYQPLISDSPGFDRYRERHCIATDDDEASLELQ